MSDEVYADDVDWKATAIDLADKLARISNIINEGDE